MRALRWLLGLRAEEERDVVAEIEERERLVAEKIAEKIETDARRKLARTRGNPTAEQEARKELEHAERVRRREEDWLRVVDKEQAKRMYGVWRRT